MQLIVASHGTLVEQPDLPEIFAFLAVVEGGSFSQAATALGVAKSSISRRVTALESKLEAQLIHRTTRTVGLTEAGEAYHAEVTAAVTRMHDAAESVRGLKAVPRGRLRVTAPIDIGATMAALVRGFLAENPEVTVEVELTQRTVDLIGERIDVALRSGNMADSSLVAQKAVSGSPLLLASPQYLAAAGEPQTPEDLLEHTFVMFRPKMGKQVLHLSGPGGARELSVRGVVGSNDFSFIRDMLVAGAGIGFVPPQVLGPLVRHGELVHVLPRWSLPQGSVHVVYASRTHLPAKVRAFRDFAIAWLQQQASGGCGTVEQ